MLFRFFVQNVGTVLLARFYPNDARTISLFHLNFHIGTVMLFGFFVQNVGTVLLARFYPNDARTISPLHLNFHIVTSISSSVCLSRFLRDLLAWSFVDHILTDPLARRCHSFLYLFG